MFRYAAVDTTEVVEKQSASQPYPQRKFTSVKENRRFSGLSAEAEPAPSSVL